MKRKLLTIITLLCAIGVTASADEGMWLLPMLRKMNSGAMKNLGCRLTPEQIYSINHSSLKDAIVQFGGGCTGEIISDEGLLVTNHHCGYGSIQALSSPEHNYLEDGYWAMNRNEELPAKGLTVTFLVSMADVTAKLNAAKTDDEKETVKKDLVKEADRANPHCHSIVQDFYNSNVFYLIIYKTYRDVRFVGAPPAASGKFGGDTDNWMWPRHTCDFSMFRVYAGADNEPADYSPDNKPYRPASKLKISLKGVQEGDFAMIMGYPGRTQRFETATELKQMEELHDISIAARTIRQDIMWKAMRSDEKIGLQYASKYAGSSNGWKKWIGEKKAFAKLDVIGREKKKEADFEKWVAGNTARTKKYAGAVEKIDSCAIETIKARKAAQLLMETFTGKIELIGFPNTFVRTANSADSASALQEAREKTAKRYKDYNAGLDRRIAAAMIRHYRENARPEDLISLPDRDFATMDIDEYVDWLYSNSSFTSEEKMRKVGSVKEADTDPAKVLFNAVYLKLLGFYRAGNSKEMESARKRFTAGLLEWNAGKPSYPDANFTMRLTYGTVKPYSPRDGVQYRHYTTLKGVIEKEDPGNYEFRVPARLKEIWNTKDFGDYAMPNGEMPTCFLTNCDITGGNSGSPVLDADGNLIGLAFDGNWESMSSDVIFEPELQRCICVDIRYVLLMMDKFGGAGYLRKEMETVR